MTTKLGPLCTRPNFEQGQIVDQDTFMDSVSSSSSKLIMLIDLAGSHKYLKSKLFGLMGQIPDFAMLCRVFSILL